MSETELTINGYLIALPESVHSQLYKSAPTCLAIFRLLPPLAKFYVMTILFNDSPVQHADFNKWIRQPAQSSHMSTGKLYQNDALRRLRQLHLIKDLRKQAVNPATGQPQSLLFYQLNPIFKSTFRNVLTGGTTDSAFGNVVDIPSQITKESLDSYSLNRWENILHFMVGSEIPSFPSVGVLSLLRHSQLMELPRGEFMGQREVSGKMLERMQITNKGFQFLLQDINSQIWFLLLQYLKLSERLMMDPVEVLNFIFMLGSLEYGKCYSVEMLSDTQLVMLKDLVDYGLIYYPENQRGSNKHFYPTRLSSMLTSDNTVMFRTGSAAMNRAISNVDQDVSLAKNDGSMLVETNFKVYCYTTSPLQIAILNLFVHLRTRFANMCTGQITRESVRRALLNGITSDQIIKYLETHAHSQMKKAAEERLMKKLELENTAPDQGGNENLAHQLAKMKVDLEIIPTTVIDQIKLWQLEMDRLQTFDGFLFKDFSSEQEFEKLTNYAKDSGVLLWEDSAKKRFFVTPEGNSQIVDYFTRRKK